MIDMHEVSPYTFQRMIPSSFSNSHHVHFNICSNITIPVDIGKCVVCRGGCGRTTHQQQALNKFQAFTEDEGKQRVRNTSLTIMRRESIELFHWRHGFGRHT